LGIEFNFARDRQDIADETQDAQVMHSRQGVREGIAGPDQEVMPARRAFPERQRRAYCAWRGISPVYRP
jgi:hypothetical protein